MYEFHIFSYFTVSIAYLIMILIGYVVLFPTPRLLVNEIAVRVMSTLASYLSIDTISIIKSGVSSVSPPCPFEKHAPL